MTLLPHLERYSRSATEPVQGAVVWLHGLGANGHDFEPVVPELGLPKDLNLRFVFPHAPSRPVTINMGMVMPSWYDILSMSGLRQVNWEQVNTSMEQTRALLAREHARGLPWDRLVLAGFSQGGAIALQTFLELDQRLAGVMALSTYTFKPDALPSAKQSVNATTPVLMHHGLHDPVVPLELAELSRQSLQAAGYALAWQTWPMEHGVCAPQIHAIGKWLAARFTP